MKKSAVYLVLGLAVLTAWLAFQYRDSLFGTAGMTGSASVGEAPGRGGPGRTGGGTGAVLVVTEPVSIDEAGDQVRAIGTVAAARSVDLYPQVTAPVEAITFEPGMPVTAGQELVLLERGDQEIAVERATIALADARDALARAEQLARSRTVSEVALSNAQSAVKNAEIELRSAELALSRRIIRAPFSGVVGLSDLSVGDLLTTSMRVATLDDTSALTVAFTVPERFADRMQTGLAVSAVASALPGQPISGALVEVDSRIDQVTRSLAVKARLDDGIEGLKPGMAVTVTASFPSVARLAVPSAALQWDRAGSYVWKIDQNAAKRTGVDVLGRRSGLVLVVGGLEAGDRVVVEGIQRLREGAEVTTAGEGPGGPNRAAGAARTEG